MKEWTISCQIGWRMVLIFRIETSLTRSRGCLDVAVHNLVGKSERARNFYIFFARNPFKSLDSEK